MGAILQQKDYRRDELQHAVDTDTIKIVVC